MSASGVKIVKLTPEQPDRLNSGGTTTGPGGTGPTPPTGLNSVSDGVLTVAPAYALEVPLGGVTDGGSGTAELHFVTTNRGGQEDAELHGSVGATLTIDLVDGNVHTATLTEACAVTITGATAGKACGFTLMLTGDFGVTWPGSVTWLTGTPSQSGLSLYAFLTVDGGTTWIGTGGSGVIGSMVPTYIPVSQTFTVPADHQALYVMPILVDGSLVVDGFLCEVD